MWINGKIVGRSADRVVVQTEEGIEISVNAENFLPLIKNDLLELKDFDFSPNVVERIIAYRKSVGELSPWMGSDILFVDKMGKNPDDKRNLESIFSDALRAGNLFGDTTLIIVNRFHELSSVQIMRNNLFEKCERLIQNLCGSYALRIWTLKNENYNLEVFGKFNFTNFSSCPEILKKLHFSPAVCWTCFLHGFEFFSETEIRDIKKILTGIVGFFRRSPSNFSSSFEIPEDKVRVFKEYRTVMEGDRMVYYPVSEEMQSVRSVALINALYTSLVSWIVKRVNGKQIEGGGFVKIVKPPSLDGENVLYNKFMKCYSDRLQKISRIYGDVDFAFNVQKEEEKKVIPSRSDTERDIEICLLESEIPLVAHLVDNNRDDHKLPKNRRDRFPFLREKGVGEDRGDEKINAHFNSFYNRIKYIGSPRSEFFEEMAKIPPIVFEGKTSIVMTEFEFYLRYRVFPSKGRFTMKNGHVFLSREEEAILNHAVGEERMKSTDVIFSVLKKIKAQSFFSARAIVCKGEDSELETAPETPTTDKKFVIPD